MGRYAERRGRPRPQSRVHDDAEHRAARLRGKGRSPARTMAFTALALGAFAANSVLCRLALGRSAIDAASFSTIRLASGAATLLLIALALRTGSFRAGGTWGSATVLFLYAVPFSFAYVSLGAGTGALI